MTKVVIIYDASYLMNERRRAPLHESPLLSGCDVVNIVAEETVGEIARLLKSRDQQERKRASLARKVLSDLEQGQSARVSYRVEAFTGTQPWAGRHPLGADSDVDKLLVGKAKALAEAGVYDAIVVASGDQGIRNEIFILRSESRLPVFFIRDPGDRDQSIDLLAEHLTFGRSSGLWKPECIIEQPTPVASVQAYFGPADGPRHMMASVDSDWHTVRLWLLSPDTGLEEIGSMRSEDPVARCHFTPDGGIFVVASIRAPSAAIASSAPLVFHFTGDCYALSPNGQLLATAHGPGKQVVALFDMARLEMVAEYAQLSPPPLPMQILAIAFSPDSRLMATGGIQTAHWPRLSRGGAYVYDVPRRECIATLFPDDGRSGVEHGITALAFSPDGQLLAAGTERGDVHLWTLPFLEPMPRHKVEGNIRALAFSPDGHILAVGSETSMGLLRAPGFDRMTPAEAVSFPSDALSQRPPAELLGLRFDRQGATLTSLWGDVRDGPSRGVVVWSAEGKHLLSFEHWHPNWFDVDRDGELAVTADQKVLRIWRLRGRPDRVSLLRA